MGEVMIRAEGLGKKYKIGHSAQGNGNPTLREAISRTVSRFGRLTKDTVRGRPLIAGDDIEEFWALRDVSFHVLRGEVIGVIGGNGAGKSTLLKVLSRITEPTEGRAEIRGRVASLLEVGTGFHPELTGRENIRLNGAILGMNRFEIRAKFDQIVAFSGVEKFLDTPVKRYSSGMHVRLAFAVAAHLDPEILIIDEVLAVGDASFQRRCLGKMKEVALDGRTVLFVSHNLRSVSDLCNRTIMLDKGRVEAIGPTRAIVGRYSRNRVEDVIEWVPDSRPTKQFRFNRLRVLNGATGLPAGDSISYTDPVIIEIDCAVNCELPTSRLGIKLSNIDGQVVLCSADTDKLNAAFQTWNPGRRVLHCKVPGQMLMPGRYSVSVSEPRDAGADIVHEDVVTFTINGFSSPSERDGRAGVIAPLLEWATIEGDL